MIDQAESPDLASAAYWDQRYEDSGYRFGREASQFVRRQSARLSPGARVLCIADGEGRNSVYLATLGHVVEASDVSDLALAKARGLARAAGVEVAFSRVDLDTYDWPVGRYDAAFAVFIQFASPPLRERIFSGLKSCVIPGGQVFLHGYTPRQLEYGTGGPPTAELLYTPEMLRKAFSDCEIVELRSYEAELDEGTGHRGMAALVDLVARPLLATRPIAPA